MEINNTVSERFVNVVMNRYVLIIGLAFFLVNIGLAQEAVKERNCLTYDISGKISQDEINQFHEFILKFYKRCNVYSSYHDSISFLDIYSVHLEDGIPFDCKSIINGDFLNYLVPEYYAVKKIKWKRKGVRIKVKTHTLSSRTVLIHNEMPIWEFWMLEFPTLKENNIYEKLLQALKEYSLVSLYMLEGLSTDNCIIGVNENKDVFIISLEYFDKILKVFPANEFVDDTFPYLFVNDKHQRIWNCSPDTTQIMLDVNCY